MYTLHNVHPASLAGPRDDDCVKKRNNNKQPDRQPELAECHNMQTRRDPKDRFVTAVRVLPFRYGVELNNAFCA